MPRTSLATPEPHEPEKVTPIKRGKKISMTSEAGVQYELVLVTPAQAEMWLAKNTDNRRIRPGAIGRYARDMQAGVWLENGSAIVFAADGTLIDGQHRLEGCVACGEPFMTLVVRNVVRSTQNTIDDGAKRTLADRFSFSGHNNSVAAAAVVRRILMWESGAKTNTGRHQPSTHEALELLDRDPTVATAVEVAVAMRGSRLLPPSIIGLAWWLFWDINPDGCQTFWDGLHTGAGLEVGSPILRLREQIIEKAAEPGRIPETVILAWVILAWNDWRAGRDDRVRAYSLKTGSKFPEPK